MILHTFVHFAPLAPEHRRTLSCPPEFFVDTVIEIALLDEEARQEKLRARLEKAAKRREVRRQQEEEKQAIDDLLEENRIRKIDELWDRLAKGVLLKFRIWDVQEGRRGRQAFADALGDISAEGRRQG